MAVEQTENKRETTVAPAGQQAAALVINNSFIDGLSIQLKLKQEYDLTFPPDYSPTNALMGTYPQPKETSNKNGKCALETCSQASTANSPMEMIIEGLNMQKKQCHPIIYGGKLQCQVSCHRWKVMAHRYGAKTIDAEIIYEEDTSKYYTKNGRKALDEYAQDFMNIDFSKIKGAYCLIILANSSRYIEVMNINQTKTVWGKGYGYKGNVGTHREFTDMMAKKTVVFRACRQIVQQYRDSVIVESVEYGDDFSGVDVVTEDIKYDIEQYANAQELPIEPEPEQPQTVIKQKEPTKTMTDVIVGQKQKEPASAADKSWMEE